VNPLWLLTGGVVVVGGAGILALLRGAAEEAKLLGEELARQREVGQAVRRLGDALRATDGRFRGRRYPSP
jgi:hypothetical protein